MAEIRTATGHYRWDEATGGWVPENARREADNLVLAILRPDAEGNSVELDIEAVLDGLPRAYHGRITGNGSAMFSHGHGLARDFAFEKRYRQRLISVRAVGLMPR